MYNINQNVIQSRIKPNVYRKNIKVLLPKTITVITQPSREKEIEIAKQNAHKNKVAVPKNNQAQKLNQAVSNKHTAKNQKTNKVNRPTKIKYITREASPDSIHKIKELRNKGRGRILVIIGNGPSITTIPLERLKNIQNIDILSINKPDPRVWPTTHWAFFDRTQYHRHKLLWESYDGIIFNSTSIKEQKRNSIQFTNKGGYGFSDDPSSGIYIGYSSVYASMQIALWMNYDRIYVLGVDMDPNGIDGKLHFYGVNPDVSPSVRSKRFEKEAKSYEIAASSLSEHDKSKIVFASNYNTWPFVNSFKKENHLIVVDKIINESLCSIKSV